jgi:hypothetical protein
LEKKNLIDPELKYLIVKMNQNYRKENVTKILRHGNYVTSVLRLGANK